MKTLLLILCMASAIAIALHAEEIQTKETAKPYPLDTCLVSGEKLGSMGEPFVYNHEGQEIKFCCSHCLPDFKENTDKYLAKMQKLAVEKKKDSAEHHEHHHDGHDHHH